MSRYEEKSDRYTSMGEEDSPHVSPSAAPVDRLLTNMRQQVQRQLKNTVMLQERLSIVLTDRPEKDFDPNRSEPVEKIGASPISGILSEILELQVQTDDVILHIMRRLEI